MKRKTYSPYGIISTRLKKIKLALKNSLLDEELLADLESCISMSDGAEKYTEQNTTAESINLKYVSEYTSNHDWSKAYDKKKSSGFLGSQMLCGHVSGQFLKMLVKIVKAKNILEIGMFSGYSALAMAESLPANGKIIACENNQYAIDIANKLFKKFGEKRIYVKKGSAIVSLNDLYKGESTFDFVFIDATKSQYPQYLNLLIKNKLIKKHTLICIDNTFLQGKVFSTHETQNTSSRVMRKFNSDLVKNPNFHTVMLPLRDGFTLLRQNDYAEAKKKY
ncbi:MAG: hypothetical protein CBD16_02975 [Betaproteobacteria bacterium TMED156]|nr:MAG: hypothetical protein CBD16_02975 [Betaproteobacteria bacterium TMED156]